MALFLLILGLVLFVSLVVVHELGHFIAARRNGVKVEEFGIFFPPRLFKKRMKNGYDFTINLLPLGGFVRLKGEHDADKQPGSFGAASLKNKTKIMLAGVVMNLLVALVLFTIVAWLGMPKLLTKDTVGQDQFTVASDTKIIKDVQNKGIVKVDQIINDSPAQKIGLSNNDQILAVAGITIDSPGKLSATTKANVGKMVTIVFKHSEEATPITKSVQLNNQSPYLGVGSYSAESGAQIRRSTWSAPVVATGLTIQMTRLTFKGLWTAVKGFGQWLAGLATHNKTQRQTGQQQATEQVVGPVGIYFILKDIAHTGLTLLLFLIATISLALAIMNLLPIPALDGGRLYLLLITRKLTGKPLSKNLEEKIVGTSFALIMALFILITIVDIHRPH